jgi:hypothetical protein
MVTTGDRGFAGRAAVAKLIGTLLKSRGTLSPSPLSLPRANSEFMLLGAPPARLSQDSNNRSKNLTDGARNRRYLSWKQMKRGSSVFPLFEE